MRPAFLGADTRQLASGAVDLVAVGQDLTDAGAHLERSGLSCAEACGPGLSAPLNGFAAAAARYASTTGAHVAGLGRLGSHLAGDLDAATGGPP